MQVDDRSGAIVEQWSGDQVAWSMARGYAGAFGRKLNAPYVWIPLCVLFLAPFLDFRRPFRLLHLDLLVLLAFGASHYFFNRGEIGVSVPLAYPVLLYLLARVLFAAFRPRRPSGALVPHASLTLLVVGLVFLAAFRIGLNVADSNVIDVGYAGVIGADRIADGHQLYGDGFSGDVERGDTYGPVNYLLYVPFEQALPWSGRWDDLPAAHGAAITFDLLALGGLLLLGRRMRPGREGTLLGRGARIRVGGLPVHDVRPGVELERHAGGGGVRGGAARRDAGARPRLRGGRRGGARAGRGREVRDRGAGAPVRAPVAGRAVRDAPARAGARRSRRSSRTAVCASCTTGRSAIRRAARRPSASGDRWTRSGGCRTS